MPISRDAVRDRQRQDRVGADHGEQQRDAAERREGGADDREGRAIFAADIVSRLNVPQLDTRIELVDGAAERRREPPRVA